MSGNNYILYHDNRATKPTTLFNKSMLINTSYNGIVVVLSYATAPTATFISNDSGSTFTIASRQRSRQGDYIIDALKFSNTLPIGVLYQNAKGIFTNSFFEDTTNIVIHSTDKESAYWFVPLKDISQNFSDKLTCLSVDPKLLLVGTTDSGVWICKF